MRFSDFIYLIYNVFYFGNTDQEVLLIFINPTEKVESIRRS